MQCYCQMGTKGKPRLFEKSIEKRYKFNKRLEDDSKSILKSLKCFLINQDEDMESEDDDGALSLEMDVVEIN